METTVKVASAAIALLMGASLFATRPHSNASEPAKPAQTHLKLAALSAESRRDVDYALLDQRLRQLIAKPSMVGMAVGVVENGRITFLHGYGETLAGSGEIPHDSGGL